MIKVLGAINDRTVIPFVIFALVSEILVLAIYAFHVYGVNSAPSCYGSLDDTISCFNINE